MTQSVTIAAYAAIVASGGLDLGSRGFEIGNTEFPNVQMANGTATGKADVTFSDMRSISASSSEDLDLNGTALKDITGADLALVKVKAIIVDADAANGGNIVISPASSNGFTGPFADASDALELPAGARVVLIHPTTGWTVTAGTGDLLNVSNSDGAAAGSYKILIVGTSA